MCLILFAWKNHPDYDLILAANRDEFYSRKTASADFWPDHPKVLGGRDLEAGGTWMGITKSGRFTAITNYRDPNIKIENALSRGFLTRNFLTGTHGPSEYLHEIKVNRERYLGFNLLVGDQKELWYFNNISDKIFEVKPGIYALSNAFLDSSWPKTDSGKALFKSKLKNQINEDEFFKILKSRIQPEDTKLPKTGVSIEWERAVSSIFIETESYGTCSSSFVSIQKNGEVKLTERTHAVLGKNSKTASFQYRIT